MKLARHILLSLSIPLLVSISTADAACRISCGALASYVNWLHGGGDSWGSGVINKSEVAALARKANAGDVDAMRRLGIISMKGIRVKPSATIAIKWWKKAATNEMLLVKNSTAWTTAILMATESAILMNNSKS